ncbi:MAG: SusE domain-containing protein [Methanosarcinaceae archaeon]|nr:SusE domain-containing protein [Methanosarcinaceae archaeon]
MEEFFIFISRNGPGEYNYSYVYLKQFLYACLFRKIFITFIQYLFETGMQMQRNRIMITSRLYVIFLLIFLLFLPFTQGICNTELPSVCSGPVILDKSVAPTKVHPGDVITVSVIVSDSEGIVHVQGNFPYEQGFDFVNLSLASGSPYHGVWVGTWIVHDTVYKEYWTTITAYSKSGLFSSANVSWWDPPEPWWNTSFRYRRQINFTEPQGLSRINTHVLFSVDLQQNRLMDENGSALVCNDVQIPFDGYATATENGWVTTLEGLAEISISSGETKTCYLYYDPVCSTMEIPPSSNGWSYVGANGYPGQNYVDLAPGDVDCSGEDTDGEFLDICGAADNIKLNEWCYFKSPRTGNVYFKTGSDDGSGLWLNDVLIVSDNNGGHGVQWRDSPAQSLIDGQYYAVEIDWAENTGGQAIYNRYDTSPGDNSNGKVINTEAYHFYGDEWKIGTTINTLEEVALPSQPILSQPLHMISIHDTTPSFQWAVGENTEKVTLLIDSEIDLSDGDEWINVSLDYTIENYTIPGGNALIEGKWYWQVIANNTHQKNFSEKREFIVDITPPLPVNLSMPLDDAKTSNNQVTFQWNATSDDTTNTSLVSDIACYQLQVDDTGDFSSPLINQNTTDNQTLSITTQIAGRLFWRVRAWDTAGNAGAFSEIRYLTIFSCSITTSMDSLQILRGTTASTSLAINKIFGDPETVNLSYDWQGLEPNGVIVEMTVTSGITNFSTILSLTTGGDADTGDFICRIHALSTSGISTSIDISVKIIGMSYLVLMNPSSISLMRSDSATSTVSVIFMMGAKDDVSLSGGWVADVPTDVDVSIIPSSGTPSYDATVTFTTGDNADAGMYTYRVTSGGGGLTQWADIAVEISKAITLTVSTDKQTYEKGQIIQFSGTAKDPEGTFISTGTATITMNTAHVSYQILTDIRNGAYSTHYYITFDKPEGIWNISVTATDTNGHETIAAQTTSISVTSPLISEHYSLTDLGPSAGQMFQRGDTVPFSVSVITVMNERVTTAEVRGILPSGEFLSFSEKSPGVYSSNYQIGYDFPIGEVNLYIEAKEFEDEKLKAGFNYINFNVSPVTLLIKLIDVRPSNLVEANEMISLKIQVLYPNGVPVEQSVIRTWGPKGTELEFSKNKLEPGMYTTSYTPSANELGYWEVIIQGEDAFGNSCASNVVQIEIVQMRFVSYLLQYWWVSLLAGILCISGLSVFIQRKYGKIRLRAVEKQLVELNSLKKKNALFYYSDYSISRETYELLSQEYETKIAQLSKKQRILERRFGEKSNDKGIRSKIDD